MRIAEDVIETVKRSVDLADVIAEDVDFEKRGNNYFACCPFHDEQTPSFSVSPEKGIYKCFGCGESGNVYSYLMKKRGLTFQESVHFLIEKYKLPITIDTLSSHTSKTSKNMYQKYYDATQAYYELVLLHTEEGKKAKTYLEKRGLSKHDIEYFHLGFSAGTSNETHAFLEHKFASEENVHEELGLLSFLQGTKDRFQERIIFPIENDYGYTIGFSGRSLDTNQAKYYNSAESSLFQKKEILYHFYKAKQRIRETKTVYLVEGFMDVIRLVHIGITNVVAAMGTSITTQHIQKLEKYASTVVLFMDGDTAGVESTLKTIQKLSKTSLEIRAIYLEDGLDPDEYIYECMQHQTNEEIRNHIETKTRSVASYMHSAFLKQLKRKGEERTEALDTVLHYLSYEKNTVLREEVLLKIAEDTELEVAILRERQSELLQKNKQSRSTQQHREDSSYEYEYYPEPIFEDIPPPIYEPNSMIFEETKEVKTSTYLYECALLHLMLQGRHLYFSIAEHLIYPFESTELQAMYTKIKEFYLLHDQLGTTEQEYLKAEYSELYTIVQNTHIRSDAEALQKLIDEYIERRVPKETTHVNVSDATDDELRALQETFRKKK